MLTLTFHRITWCATVLGVFVMVWGTACAETPASFQAGCARERITPPLGVQLAGYFHERLAKSVYDDLYARAVVIESAGVRIALVSCDLISMTEEVSKAAKQLIETETGIPTDHIMI